MKSLPGKPSLEFLKKEAKALRKLHHSGDPICCDRIKTNDNAFQTRTDAEILAEDFSIDDAQRIVAREYGYSSWATLKQYVESLGSPIYHNVKNKQSYHKTITDSYDKRSANYDKSEWHRELAIKLVDYCPPEKGHTVLDIATGTGTIAFYTADIVGPQGSVTGIDISSGMLNKCNEKLKASGISQLQFTYADAENLDFPANSFDRIYCSSAFFWMAHPQAALRHWHEQLKPGGQLAFNAWPDTSFVWGGGARQTLRKFGLDFICGIATGNPEKLRKLVELAGFHNIKVHVDEQGRYLPVEDVKGPPLTIDAYAPGQDPHPLLGISDEIKLQMQHDFETEVDKRVTDKGVWHDMTMFYVHGQKL